MYTNPWVIYDAGTSEGYFYCPLKITANPTQTGATTFDCLQYAQYLGNTEAGIKAAYKNVITALNNDLASYMNTRLGLLGQNVAPNADLSTIMSELSANFTVDIE